MASSDGPDSDDGAFRYVYQKDTPAAGAALASNRLRPRLERAGTNLSNCNGEMGAGSSNITLYIVWPYVLALWVAQTLQQKPSFQGRKKSEAGESREHLHGSATGTPTQRTSRQKGRPGTEIAFNADRRDPGAIAAPCGSGGLTAAGFDY